MAEKKENKKPVKIKWLFQDEKEPTVKDLPFLTYNPEFKTFEVWDDSDWFHDLTDEDRAERQVWRPLLCPIKN